MPSRACSASARSRCRQNSDAGPVAQGKTPPVHGGISVVTPNRDRVPPNLSSTRTIRRLWARLVVSRVFIVAAAAGFVIAFGIAALAPVGLTLAGGLERLDPGTVAALHGYLPDVAWRDLVAPFLIRPAWILPLMLSLVSIGLAISIRRPVGTSLRPRS